jgi:A/G-specific adenine glycosylase
MTIYEFQERVWDYYAKNGRSNLPWRAAEVDGTFDPYKILVSEIMLQQTQVPRVIEKYTQWIALFPNVGALAAASLADVLSAWQGLGYNRRAKFLHETAKIIASSKKYMFPRTRQELMELPGIGSNTAAAIVVYAFNEPQVFIETNIRTVYLHHFFDGTDRVDDKMLLPIIEESIDYENPREWFWALMDYGVYVKKTHQNPARKSKHHTKQSTFEGSDRQIRGKIIKLLTTGAHNSTELQKAINDPRMQRIVSNLVDEGMIQRIGNAYQLPR